MQSTDPKFLTHCSQLVQKGAKIGQRQISPNASALKRKCCSMLVWHVKSITSEVKVKTKRRQPVLPSSDVARGFSLAGGCCPSDFTRPR